jgi:hypothetical protein
VALLIPAGIFKDIGFSKSDKPLTGGVSTQPGMSTVVSIPKFVNWSANRRTAYATPPRVKNGSNSHEIMVTDFTNYLSPKSGSVTGMRHDEPTGRGRFRVTNGAGEYQGELIEVKIKLVTYLSTDYTD